MSGHHKWETLSRKVRQRPGAEERLAELHRLSRLEAEAYARRVEKEREAPERSENECSSEASEDAAPEGEGTG